MIRYLGGGKRGLFFIPKIRIQEVKCVNQKSTVTVVSKYKYSDTEQQINNVLKYHDEELKKNKATQPSTSELDSRIQESEDLLRMLGYKEMPIVPRREGPKKMMVVPSWEDLCIEAENAVGTGNALESIFTAAELQTNAKEIRMLNEEYNQLYHLDRYDIAISVVAGILAATVNILLVGIPQKRQKA